MKQEINFDKKRKMNILAPAGNYEKLVAAVMYLALTAIFTRVMTRVERRLKDGSE